MTETERNDPHISVVFHEDTWAARWVDPISGAGGTVRGSRSAAGAVLGAASKLSTLVHRARIDGDDIADRFGAVTYPAFAAPLDLDDHSNGRLRKRLDDHGMTLVPGDVAELHPDDLDEVDTDLAGVPQAPRRPSVERREARHRGIGTDLGAVVYWADGSARDHADEGSRVGGWGWVREDFALGAGQVIGSAATAELAAIRAAIANAEASGAQALVVTDQSQLAANDGRPVPFEGHWLLSCKRNTTMPMILADALADDAARAHEAELTRTS